MPKRRHLLQLLRHSKDSQHIPAKIIAQAIEAFANFGYSIRLTFAHRSNYAVNNLVWLIKFASC
jgi:hypothetical protein